MGDNMARWDHLWLQIPMGTGLSISGQSFVGADIGGFAENSNAELFARWIQAGALTPFARNHNQTNQLDQYAFAWGDDVLTIARDAVKLRYRLLPYLYAAFVEASQSGAPIQRPLVFDYQSDPNVWELDDQYLLGGQLLVAPVLEAGATARGVYLPAGEWFDWHSGRAVRSAGQTVRAEAPLDRIPLYAKAGSVIPMWTEAPSSTADHYPTEMELRVFVPAADGVHHSLMQEDDGLTFGALNGECVRTEITLTRSGNTLRIQGSVQGTGFPEFARENLIITLIGAATESGARLIVPNRGEDFDLSLNI
jgi:alpha-glucosidase